MLGSFHTFGLGSSIATSFGSSSGFARRVCLSTSVFGRSEGRLLSYPLSSRHARLPGPTPWSSHSLARSSPDGTGSRPPWEAGRGYENPAGLCAGHAAHDPL